MAERIFKKKSQEAGLDGMDVTSASVLHMEGALADPVAAGLLESRGFDSCGHKSKPLTENRVAAADMILVMERNHKEVIMQRYPEAKEKVFMLKSFSADYTGLENGDKHDDIADPYRRSIYRYRACFEEIYMAIEGVLKYI
jgi:protein-tyrosine phosphatase